MLEDIIAKLWLKGKDFKPQASSGDVPSTIGPGSGDSDTLNERTRLSLGYRI